jgi:hypothetical protein
MPPCVRLAWRIVGPRRALPAVHFEVRKIRARIIAAQQVSNYRAYEMYSCDFEGTLQFFIHLGRTFALKAYPYL